MIVGCGRRAKIFFIPSSSDDIVRPPRPTMIIVGLAGFDILMVEGVNFWIYKRNLSLPFCTYPGDLERSAALDVPPSLEPEAPRGVEPVAVQLHAHHVPVPTGSAIHVDPPPSSARLQFELVKRAASKSRFGRNRLLQVIKKYWAWPESLLTNLIF